MGEQSKSIAILGSTGSIGSQALAVIEAYPQQFNIELLTANDNADLLIRQAKEHKPRQVIIGNPDKYREVSAALNDLPITVHAGAEAMAASVKQENIDLVLTAMVGYAGLSPTLNAIEAGKTIALANKETLVVAGELIKQKAEEHRVDILPVDSEHSAIFQCLTGEEKNRPEKIILTASGGPFLGRSPDFLSRVNVKEALNHPNWCMGDKITIDSASLMNKGLEAIEARWLFSLDPKQIEVVIHPQSIVHSMVQFEDGSIKAQMGLPDMRLPILYALSYPQRLKTNFQRFSFADYPQLTFEQPDYENFRNLRIALDSMTRGGNMPCIMNAANEVVVNAFIQEKIGFMEMPDIIEGTMAKVGFIKNPGYSQYVETDIEARRVAQDMIG